ncbi:MAG: glycosyltransferase [Maioricimonas sp. JB049]
MPPQFRRYRSTTRRSRECSRLTPDRLSLENTPMRILLVNHEYPPRGGGSGVAMQCLAGGLADAGHEVCVLTMASEAPRPVDQRLQLQEIPTTSDRGRLPGLRTWMSFLWNAPAAIRCAVRDFRPDVVNSHFVFPAGFVVVRSGVEVPHVTSVVGADIHDPTRRVSADCSRLIRRLTVPAIRSSCSVTTPSVDLTQRTQALFPAADVRTVPWGVPLLESTDTSRKSLGLPRDALVVATLCRLVRRKRLDLLLRAVSQINSPDVFVAVLGSGPERGPLEALASSLGIAHQVRFAGRVTEYEKHAYLENADIFCLPSDHEGFGLVFLEAMGLKTAVVCTDVGGQTDIVREGIDGYLIPVNDADALAMRLRTLLKDSAQLETMKRQAAERAREYQPARTADEFIQVYGEAIQHRENLHPASDPA